ncbi:WAT1-related protein [Raphanus sativus]|uniref:WAT1-related protein n=1 Tax=Raphanus sativus TaxID=3726 RepID=A0A6J0N8D4_RAPSA|nr:WAT1-related protein At2g39510 [Raphanus sativus]KAJ4903912.1 WAT1-related protein [Raphanus sativus]
MALKTWKPFLTVISLQFGYAGLSIIAKFALDRGMSPHVLAAYRHIVATIFIAPFAFFLDRKVRPKMTLPIFLKIALLGLLEPTIDQNLYYTGMKYTSATFTAAMTNVLPAFAFLMAWIFRLEKVNIKKIHSQAKILGTVVTVGGAMLMTVMKGPLVPLLWANPDDSHQDSSNPGVTPDLTKGALLIAIGCICWAGFVNLQAITLKSYPVELSLTAYICLMGSIEGTIVALFIERGNPSAWAIQLDSKLLAAVYGGVICSGVGYYVQGVIMKTRGPVFVTAFNPLSMVIVAILGSIILAEVMYLGRILGAIVIVLGLYSVLWGKSKDEPSNSFSDMDTELPRSTPQVVTFSLKANTETDTKDASVL